MDPAQQMVQSVPKGIFTMAARRRIQRQAVEIDDHFVE
jgi:hypothetical protein